jgi:hypothetical protein
VGIAGAISACGGPEDLVLFLVTTTIGIDEHVCLINHGCAWWTSGVCAQDLVGPPRLCQVVRTTFHHKRGRCFVVDACSQHLYSVVCSFCASHCHGACKDLHFC